ncbi:MAG: peptidase S9 [Ignavibacteriae bacterium]|nr:MAG: peptidase S9 [Ignavibacteriota bacterium]
MFSITHAQKRAFTIEDYYKLINISNVQVSKNNQYLLYTKTTTNLRENKSLTSIFISDFNGKNERKLTSCKHSNYNPIWDIDDKGFYFISYRTGTAQLYYLSLDGGEAKQITDFYFGINSPKLSPDGKKIIFTAEVFPEIGINEKKTKELEDAIKNGPVQAYLADSLFVRHWTEYNIGKYTHIILYNFENKKYTDLTPGSYNSPTFSPGGSNDYNFSPDSKHVVFSSKRVSNPEASTNSDVWFVDIDSKNLKNLTSSNKGYDGFGEFSPNGKYIAYKSQLTPGYESDRWYIKLYNLATGKTETITKQIDNGINDYEWSNNSQSIFLTIDEKGYNPLLKLNIENKKYERLIENLSLHGFTLSNDDKNIFYTYSLTHQPKELARYDLASKKITQLSDNNKSLKDEIDLRKAEAVWVKGANNRDIQAFIIKPYNFNKSKKYPLILNVHGGPQMQWRDYFRASWQIFPGAGYVYVFVNPHGSTGYGSAFTKDISKNWDGNVYKDVMKVVDYLEELPYVDKERMGAMGWSYGGYFMNLLQAKGNRFKCLASMMGIYDLEQFYLETEELWFPNYDLGGAPWELKERYAKQSPSSYIENFKTPTLIITGEKDYRISYTQSLKYFTVLQLKGIDSRLIIFKNDGHWSSSLTSMPLYFNAHLEWFHKYLGGAPAPWDSKEMVRNQIFE